MIRTVFERSWRTNTRWKRRFYARYMTWLERIGYAVVLLLLGAFVLAFNYKVDDLVKADGVALEPASVSISSPQEGQVLAVLKENLSEVKAGDVILTLTPGLVEIKASQSGTLRLDPELTGKKVKEGDVLFKVADYGVLVIHAKLKGESISAARVGQGATISHIKIDDPDKTLLRGDVGGMAIVSRQALGSELRKDLGEQLKGERVQTRNDVPLTIEEVTEVEVDATLKSGGSGAASGIELDPGPDFSTPGRIASGNHMLTAQIADIPLSARKSADALVAKALTGSSLTPIGDKPLGISSAQEPHYLVKVKAKLATDSTGAPKSPVLQGTAIDRYFDAEIRLTDPPAYLVRKLREADERGQAITVTVEVRTGSKPLAFTLLKRS